MFKTEASLWGTSWRHESSVPVETARQSVVLLYYCHDSRGSRGGLELVEVPRHVYEFIAPFVPGPVIQRTGTYRLLGSLLLYVVKRDGEGVGGSFPCWKGGTRNPFFLIIKTRTTPANTAGGKERDRKRKGGIFRNFSVEKMDAGRGKGCADDA